MWYLNTLKTKIGTMYVKIFHNQENLDCDKYFTSLATSPKVQNNSPFSTTHFVFKCKKALP